MEFLALNNEGRLLITTYCELYSDAQRLANRWNDGELHSYNRIARLVNAADPSDFIEVNS